MKMPLLREGQTFILRMTTRDMTAGTYLITNTETRILTCRLVTKNGLVRKNSANRYITKHEFITKYENGMIVYYGEK